MKKQVEKASKHEGSRQDTSERQQESSSAILQNDKLRSIALEQAQAQRLSEQRKDASRVRLNAFLDRKLSL
jgi:hypothetical protein